MTSEVSVVRKVLCAFYVEVHNTDPLCPEARPCDLQWGILHHLNVAPGMVLGAGVEVRPLVMKCQRCLS